MASGLRDLEALRAGVGSPTPVPRTQDPGASHGCRPHGGVDQVESSGGRVAVRAPCESGGRVQSIKEDKDVGLNRIGASKVEAAWTTLLWSCPI